MQTIRELLQDFLDTYEGTPAEPGLIIDEYEQAIQARIAEAVRPPAVKRRPRWGVMINTEVYELVGQQHRHHIASDKGAKWYASVDRHNGLPAVAVRYNWAELAWEAIE